MVEIKTQDDCPALAMGQQTYWNVGRRQHVPPARYQEASLNKFEASLPRQKEILNYLESYAKSFKQGTHGLLLHGTLGTGKTHLAIALVRAIADRCMRAVYITVPELLVLVQNPIQGERGIIDDLNSYDLLVLDDVGEYGGFGWNQELVVSTLFQLIDARYSNRLTTVLVTEMTPDQMDAAESSIGRRTMDRLRSDGLVALSFDWGGKK